MKYVRTKDGRIIKIGEQTDTGYAKGTLEIHNKTGIAASYEPFEVLKQAGTIEELCDEFVGIDTQGHYIIHNNEFVEGARIIPLEKVNYYGAIWTDKGLIYVAKMNEKGELELL